MFSRREFLRYTGQACLAAGSAPLTSALMKIDLQKGSGSVRCINVVNFIRGVEPRFETDLLLPVRKQMELILEHKLPATWLLQFDALVAGPFVEFLKANMAANHEVGFWFEMNEKLCDAAEVAWRGRPGYEWDHLPPVAFTIGYTPEERIKLADAAMKGFKAIWGRYPSSIASWNLDSITIAHLSEHYGVDAYAVCRDQIATDGFTIWGSPIAGYYPSKKNCWSPALRKENQISTPIFRMLGQDPVYYYHNGFKLPNGHVVRSPDTMEPTWISGQTPEFVKAFLDMIAVGSSMKFGYAQLGQENSFPWDGTADAYPKQMKALADLRDAGTVHVETMGDSGRRFKKAFGTTPTQAQVMLDDPFGNTNPSESTIWYQSRFYRVDLHVRGDLPFLRDITVYSDLNPQPFLTKATRDNDVEQRMPAVLDGYHWRKNSEEIGSGGFFEVGGERLRLAGRPAIREEGNSMLVDLPLTGGKTLHVRFDEQKISVRISPSEALTVSFEWDPAKSALTEVQAGRVSYRWQGFDYSVGVGGVAKASASGWTLGGDKGEVSLQVAQPA